MRRGQRLSKGHILVGHPDLTASAEGFAAQPPTQAGLVLVWGLSCHCPSFSCCMCLVSQLMPGMSQSDM